MKPITDKQFENLVNKTFKPLSDKLTKISEDIKHKEKFITLVDKAISFKIDAGKEIPFLDTKELGDILYSFIFEQNSSLKEMTQPEMITGIINESLYSSHEHLMSDEIFVASITRWLKYHVIPYIYEHKTDYEIKNKEPSLPPQDIVETKWNIINKELLHLSIISALDALNFQILTDKLYDLLITKNLTLNDIVLNPYHINFLIRESLFESKKQLKKDVKEEIEEWLRKTAIPKVFNELEIQQKSPEEVISTGFSGIPLKLEIISKSQITTCIFPLNLNYISKDKFDQLPKKHDIINILHSYFNTKKDIIIDETIEHSDYIYDRMFYNDQKNLKFSKEFKETTFQWLNRSVIPCIIKIIKEEEPKEYIPEFKQIEFEINKESLLYKRMDKIVRDFYDSFYFPHHHLCLYYTYYILKLKENHDFDFEFRELENKLYKDFYNYGIFACIGELRHFIETFHFIYYTEERYKKTKGINDYITNTCNTKEETIFKLGFKKFTSDISECVGIDVKDIYKIINIDKMYQYTQILYNNRNIDEKENKITKDIEFLYLIEKYFGYFTRPDNILKVALKSFNISKENKIKCRWSESYGGEAWGSIAKTMLSRNNLVSKTIFVDTCWSLQHNTNLFLDKVYCYDCEDNSLSLIKRYLTEIKDGIFEEVYKCAIKHNTKLDRFIYKNLILENAASVPDVRYSEEQSNPELEIEKIKHIIINNINKLENPEMKNIILSTINVNALSTILQELIYKYDYTSIQIKEHVDVLITDGFYDSKEETTIQDPEVISLLKIWIDDYLIDDLMKGTTLQPGGLAALFA